ncbi:hypothetical protein ACBJ59_52005 [Nonomuraea sp. MTCD27]|uniref:hypothetical protein n=1 Tax=Nonomuraea sp. MTCD27 TaxID=1676747 RepID=UPI0035C0A8BF
MLDYGEAVQAGERDRLDGEEISGQHPGCLGLQELRPCLVAAPGRGIDSGLPQDRPHGGGETLRPGPAISPAMRL